MIADALCLRSLKPKFDVYATSTISSLRYLDVQETLQFVNPVIVVVNRAWLITLAFPHALH